MKYNHNNDDLYYANYIDKWIGATIDINKIAILTQHTTSRQYDRLLIGPNIKDIN